MPPTIVNMPNLNMLLMVHPSKSIVGEISDELKGKRILLGVTGSISLYRSIDLARAIMRRGAEVYIIMTEAASELISRDVFAWATGNPVVTELTGELEHVTLAEESDAMLVAPASADTINKMALGIADNALVATFLNMVGMRKPIMIVPAMHAPMYSSPQVKDSLNKLRGMGVKVVEPVMVRDVAHYPEQEELLSRVIAYVLRGEDLSGLGILVTAGPTREYMDPVRFISNPSSGLMGISIANEAAARGALVRLVKGPTELRSLVEEVRVETTDQMAREVERELDSGRFKVAILAGAPADFKFNVIRESKVDSHTEVPEVKLERTNKVSEVLKKYDLLKVGFSAETVESEEALAQRAKRKMERHGFDMVVANNVARRDIGFSSTHNEVLIVTRDRIIKVSKSPKWIVARRILDVVKEELKW